MSDISDFLNHLPADRARTAFDLVHYMLGKALKSEDADEVLTEMAERIGRAGVPLDRATSIVPLLHAEAVASARFWERGSGARSYLFPYTPESGDGYAHSPAAVVHETGEWVRLWLPETPDDTYGIVPELKEAGYTDYLMAPVFMKSGMAGTFSFATRAPNGFSDEDLAFLRLVFPALAGAQDILATTRAMQEVMRMYVGAEPQRRILSGDVHRGEVMRIRSAILFADMRRFTELTVDMSAEEATQLLNAYYDCIVPPIEEAGGEVLKFIGDGILAIFRAEGAGNVACFKAIQAAQEGLDRVAHRNGSPSFDVGIALHLGEVAYGNVGSGLRLDYTVIGRDVNLAARVAGLCGTLGEPLLVSDTFRGRIADAGKKTSGGPVSVWSVGVHALKGLHTPLEVFAVAVP
ncbi:adenylate/guanylate cyclase domain-containing protein [Primorskyibacter sp. S87]|uniref:adenylate/guanylate cyclase domain-containing protein n=1 Tax=Primorskyibacter sp. S87 TaxID=3415126 RepID=UPI003C7E34CB